MPYLFVLSKLTQADSKNQARLIAVLKFQAGNASAIICDLRYIRVDIHNLSNAILIK